MKIPDILKRDLTIKRVAEEMSIDEKLLRSHLTKFTGSKKRQTEARQPRDQITGNLSSAKSADYKVEMAILGLMINRNDLIKKSRNGYRL